MDSLRIDIVTPRAENLLKEMEQLNLIVIREPVEKRFASLLKRLRKNSGSAPIPASIAKEVKALRRKRYG